MLLRLTNDSRRGSLYLKDMENLARAGAAGWLLSQERARLDYLAAKEAYCNSGTWSAFQRMLVYEERTVVQRILFVRKQLRDRG